MIENFGQLKRQVIPGAEIEIVGYGLASHIGQMRRITKVDEKCFYTIIPGHPEHWVSRENGGLGDSFWWRTDSFWEFEDGVCSLYDNLIHHDEKHLIIAFKLKEDN